MANNYLNFSLAVGLNNDGEKEWCREGLEFLQELLYGNIDPDEPANDKEKELCSVFESFLSDETGCGLEFEWSIDRENDKDELWIHADESGSPDQVAKFLQAFLVKFRPEEGMWFSWSYTCSKMRVNEFGGGACAITAKEMEFFDPDRLAQEYLEKGGLSRKETNLWTKQ